MQAWNIPVGARILEVGCGQGDMTAVLAEAVGRSGYVTAVDVAGADYGAPMTLKEATDRIKASDVGDRVDFRFNFDIMCAEAAFGSGSFDYAVLAHSLWYFASLGLLRETLGRLRQWVKRLCVAEWDLEARRAEQVSHLLAVLIQGQVEAFKDESVSNIRTPLSVPALRHIIEEAGWKIVSHDTIEADDLQDADWEISLCLKDSLEEARRLALPTRLLGLLETEVDLLTRTAKPKGNKPLPVFCASALDSSS